jgi:predicted transglutaminase-like cysteine proteinase
MPTFFGFIKRLFIDPVPRDIRAINRKWNRVPYVPEKKQTLTSCEYFKANGGDCEEYAICKQADLVDAGYIKARIVLGYIGKGTAHAICEVDGWYLDNRTDKISKTPFDFKEM